jgi:hypothetical protein
LTGLSAVDKYTPSDPGLKTLLDLDDTIYEQGGGYWAEIHAREVPRNVGKPHGVDYSLSLFGPDGKRLVGYDNAHPVKKGEGKFMPMAETNDHLHKRDKVKPYQYANAVTLLEDFWADVASVLKDEGVS